MVARRVCSTRLPGCLRVPLTCFQLRQTRNLESVRALHGERPNTGRPREGILGAESVRVERSDRLHMGRSASVCHGLTLRPSAS